MAAPLLVPTFGWPPFLTTKLAALYIGRSRHGVYKLVRRRELSPVSRRGREMIFARESLDAWMSGTPLDVTSPAPSLHVLDGGKLDEHPASCTNEPDDDSGPEAA